MTNTAVTLTSAIRTSYDVVTVVMSDSSFNTYTAAINLQDTGLTAPAAPSLTTVASGGTYLAGTYFVRNSFVDANGETVGSASSSIVTTGTTSEIVVASPTLVQGTATGYYTYISSLAAPTVLTRYQTAGSPTALGTALTATTPSTSGANVLTVATDTPVTNLVRAFFAA